MSFTADGCCRPACSRGPRWRFPRWGWAQTSSPLASAPKIALVLGNGRYRDAPLRNPVNDAKAVGAELGSLGFAVTLRTDVGRSEMTAAVQAYVAEVTKRRGAGIFYYAGHGVQLPWRNYMVRVDASVESIADIQGHGVEVASLLNGLARAKSGLNVIILGRGVFGDQVHRHAEETKLKKWVTPDRLRMPVVIDEIRQRGVGKHGRVTQSRRWELVTAREG